MLGLNKSGRYITSDLVGETLPVCANWFTDRGGPNFFFAWHDNYKLRIVFIVDFWGLYCPH